MEKDSYVGINLPKLAEMRKDLNNDNIFRDWFIQLMADMTNAALEEILKED